MREMTCWTVQPVAQRLGRAAVVFVVCHHSLARDKRFGRAVTMCDLIPEHRGLTTRVDVAPVESSRNGELLQPKRSLSLDLTFDLFVQIDPDGRLGTSEREEIS